MSYYNEKQESSFQQTGLALVKRLASGRWMKWGLVAAGLVVADHSWFVVSPNERANVRRMGEVQYAVPLQQGLHFKVPLIDRVDRLVVSQNTHELPNIDIGTVDNQRARITVNYVYTIPEQAVNRLLYQTGEIGEGGIHTQVEKTVRAATVRTFASQNMNTVNQNLLSINHVLEDDVKEQLAKLYQIDVHRLQIQEVKPSDSFLASNEAAVRSKNEAVAAQNITQRVRYEADQATARAKGLADAAIEQARGEAQSMLARAEADRQRLVLLGQGEQARLQAEIQAFGGPQTYVQYLQAKAMMNWNGSVPAVQAGNNGLNLLMPLSPQAAAAITMNGGGTATPTAVPR